MKFGHQLVREAFSDWAKHYIDYKGLKKILGQAVQTAAQNPAAGSADPATFLRALEAEIARANEFYVTTERACFEKYEALQAAVGGQAQASTETLSVLLDFSRFLDQLRRFVVLNYIAVLKIVKKRNKKMRDHWPELQPMPLLLEQPFYRSFRLAQLVTKCELLTAELIPYATVKENYLCPICVNLLTNPVVLSCAHRFCWSCLCSTTQELSCCPLCRKEILLDPSHFSVDATLSKFISDRFRAHDLSPRAQGGERRRKLLVVCASSCALVDNEPAFNAWVSDQIKISAVAPTLDTPELVTPNQVAVAALTGASESRPLVAMQLGERAPTSLVLYTAAAAPVAGLLGEGVARLELPNAIAVTSAVHDEIQKGDCADVLVALLGASSDMVDLSAVVGDVRNAVVSRETNRPTEDWLFVVLFSNAAATLRAGCLVQGSMVQSGPIPSVPSAFDLAPTMLSFLGDPELLETAALSGTPMSIAVPTITAPSTLQEPPPVAAEPVDIMGTLPPQPAGLDQGDLFFSDVPHVEHPMSSMEMEMMETVPLAPSVSLPDKQQTLTETAGVAAAAAAVAEHQRRQSSQRKRSTPETSAMAVPPPTQFVKEEPGAGPLPVLPPPAKVPGLPVPIRTRRTSRRSDSAPASVDTPPHNMYVTPELARNTPLTLHTSFLPATHQEKPQQAPPPLPPPVSCDHPEYMHSGYTIVFETQPVPEIRTASAKEVRTFPVHIKVNGPDGGQIPPGLVCKAELMYAPAPHLAVLPAPVPDGHTILCGKTVVSVSPKGTVAFALHVTDTSAKHGGREFSLAITLYSGNQDEPLARVYSSSFYAYSHTRVLERRKNVKLRAISATTGPVAGGTKMHLIGSPFIAAPSLACVFTTSFGAVRAPIDDVYLQCVAFFVLPPCPGGPFEHGQQIPAIVQITNDGRNFSDPITFNYVAGQIPVEHAAPSIFEEMAMAGAAGFAPHMDDDNDDEQIPKRQRR